MPKLRRSLAPPHMSAPRPRHGPQRISPADPVDHGRGSRAADPEGAAVVSEDLNLST